MTAPWSYSPSSVAKPILSTMSRRTSSPRPPVSIGLLSTFTTYGLDAEPWSARAGVGLTHTTANGTEITLRYDAEHREAFLNQTASLKARWAF